MNQRKPRVDPLVPTYYIDRILGRTHVVTSDTDVTAMIQERIDAQTDPRWTDTIKRQTIRYALWRHHRNLAEYAYVMRGQKVY